MASEASARGSLIRVRVSPGSSRDRVVGFQGDELKVSLTAPPVDGKANAALLGFIAKTLGLRASDLELRSGASGRSKVLRVTGLSKEEALSRLAGAADPGQGGKPGPGKRAGKRAGKGAGGKKPKD
ncbi:MAG: DUF167 domain-containing protein [Deltaproteobacteria bacterium]|jgi:uncharacterized protein (TIGR00251 family)|nr:DUF167 domain-containing protein [Deltaproteobacteria bacterium]